MADTGENRQIIGRANAKEAETVRASKRMMSKERSTENAGDVAFSSKKNSGRLLRRARQSRFLPKLRSGELIDGQLIMKHDADQ